MSDKLPILYTVGHSVHPIEHFLYLLKKNNIRAIVDVRSLPFSKYTPQFNQDSLQKTLKDNSIYYIFMGKELGARRDEFECYSDNKVIYSKVVKTPAFREGIKRLKEGAHKMAIAIMCAEKDPLTCHRTVLVARYGRNSFSEIRHILVDGSIETGHKADMRLLKEYKMDLDDFFTTYDERLETAYTKRAEKIAYEEQEDEVANG